MTAIAHPTAPVPATRRQRAARVVERALRGGILGAAVAAVAWLVAVAADESLTEPWGSSWLWLPAVLGPVIGARTLLNPSPKS